MKRRILDGRTDRVSDCDEAFDLELFSEHGDIVGAIGESEMRADAHASAVSAVIDNEDSIGLGKRVEDRPPIQQSGRSEPVQEHQRLRVLRPFRFPYEDFAAAAQHDGPFSPMAVPGLRRRHSNLRVKLQGARAYLSTVSNHVERHENQPGSTIFIRIRFG